MTHSKRGVNVFMAQTEVHAVSRFASQHGFGSKTFRQKAKFLSFLNLLLLWFSHKGRFRALNVFLVQAAFGSSRPGPVHPSCVSARCPNRPREEYHAAQHFSVCSFSCIHLVFTRFTHHAGTRHCCAGGYTPSLHHERT